MTTTELTDAQGQREGSLLVVVHIPKTAGSSLKAIMRRRHPDLVVRNIGNILKDQDKAVREVRRLGPLMSEDRRYLAAQAHIPFGFHRHFAPDTRYVTFVRDPIERVVSNHFHETERYIKSGEMPLLPEPEHVLRLRRPYLDNLQTRFLCGVEAPLGVPASEDLLEEAKANLRDRFAFVGLTERFDESLVLLNGVMGWPLSTYRTVKGGTAYHLKRYGRSRPRVEELSPASLAVFEEHNDLDRRLYAYARELFEERLAAARDARFDDDVAALRLSLAPSPGEDEMSPERRAERLLAELDISEIEVRALKTERKLRKQNAELTRRVERLEAQVRALSLPGRARRVAQAPAGVWRRVAR